MPGPLAKLLSWTARPSWLAREGMVAEAAAFTAALQHDLIDAADFA